MADVSAGQARTAAATRVRKAKAARRLASDLAPRLGLLPDDFISALAGLLLAEAEERGVVIVKP